MNDNYHFLLYRTILRQRTAIPKVVRNAKNEERLVILPNEEMNASDTTNIGRPIGAEYFDVRDKLQFMDAYALLMYRVGSLLKRALFIFFFPKAK